MPPKLNAKRKNTKTQKRRNLTEAGMEAFERENNARDALGMELTTNDHDDHDLDDGYLADEKGRDRRGGSAGEGGDIIHFSPGSIVIGRTSPCLTSSGSGGVAVDGVGRLAVLKRSVDSKVGSRMEMANMALSRYGRKDTHVAHK